MRTKEKRDYDAVVVGSGPNGLSAAIRLQQAGLSVLLLEARATVGGGTRSLELTLPGFVHDVCSAVHPLGADSPFFNTLPLHEHGLDFVNPRYALAHPFDDGSAAHAETSIEHTAKALGMDEARYQQMLKPLVERWPLIVNDVLGPLTVPSNPFAFAQFGMKAITSAKYLAREFSSPKTRGLWAGVAAHSMLPLSKVATSAIGLVLLITAHRRGWPFARGGSQKIADALASYFVSLGGKIETNVFVHSMTQLPSAHAVLFDVSPRQLLKIAGNRFSPWYRSQLERYRYGMGVFKIDWALDDPAPFKADQCRHAGTVHIGNTFEEVAHAEQQVWEGKTPEKPFVLYAQQSLFDPSRAPEGKHTAWGYCHVPRGSTVDMTKRIEDQMERFAPGFRDRILARHTLNAVQMEEYNPNYVGGDINGGASDIGQIFTRPALKLSPYRTSAKGLYLCSSSTPPGGGVHGICGLRAAERALKDVFGLRIENKL